MNPSLPSNVIEIVEHLMEISPADRYQTPAEVIADLKEVLGQSADSKTPATPGAPDRPSQPTVICVETRPRQQDALREYFSKHSYRVLMLGDPQRALQRAKTERPAGLVVMAEMSDDEARDFYAKAVAACRKSGTALILALSRSLNSLRDQLADSPGVSRVLAQPVTLRDIRSAIEELRAAARP